MFAPVPVYKSDVVIVGGGIAGLVSALELLDSGLSLLILDRDREGALGGLARESFGGICAVSTPLQKRMGIPDTPEIAWDDWKRVARFDNEDHWSKIWAQTYIERSKEGIYDFLLSLGVKFLPVVNWPERGMLYPSNSLPRWHIAWGTGYRIIECLLDKIKKHPNSSKLEFRFAHKVDSFHMKAGRLSACSGRIEGTKRPFEARAERFILAAGGICGGGFEMLRKHWPANLKKFPDVLLNGSHRFADGVVHRAVEKIGGKLDHLDRQWHYAAGIRYPGSLRENHGLSLVPPRSGLWFNARGERIGPVPLSAYTDTSYIVERLCQEEEAFSWIVLNRRIALKELAVSGCDYMTAFRHRRFFKMLRELLFGNKELVGRLLSESRDMVSARTLKGLHERMQKKTPEVFIDFSKMEAAVLEYDRQISWGPAFFTDDQLRRIAISRKYRGDRLRTCKFQAILDPDAGPLIAVRSFILSRKSLGGVRSDLSSRVLDFQDQSIPGLFAVGENAGFGGGNMHGRGALEGTFLGGAILTARYAARAIIKDE